MPQESPSKGGKRPVRIGKYEVIAHIATGGMGAVYKALDTDLGRLVALKVLPPEMAAKPNMLERFKREARSAARLRHENIVAIFECGKWGDTNYLALEFVAGCDLHDYITPRGRLESDEARHILMQAARALEHAARNKIVHRDIKPSNFLLTADEEGRLLVKLTDLGLARQVHDEEFRVTRADSTIGTVDYMSPEQAQNSGAADVRSDIYSLGCTFYHMLSGKCPFPTGSLVERILKHREAEPPDIRGFNASVPESLIEILRKMLAKNPDERFQTPQELLQALQDPVKFPPTRVPQFVHAPTAAQAPPAVKSRAPKAQPAEVPATIEQALRGNTAEVPRQNKTPEKLAVAKKKPSRSAAREKPPPKRKKNQLASWWPWAVGWAIALIVVGVIWSILGTREHEPLDDGQTNSAELLPKREKASTPVKIPHQTAPPKKNGPEEPVLPRLISPPRAQELVALRRDFLGPFQSAPLVPADSRVVKVRRLPGPAEYRSVAEAITRTTGPVLVEIHDQGPLFETSLPEVGDRVIHIRAGSGYRPLVAWDLGASDSASPLMRVNGGGLTLEGLDFVAKWPAGRAAGPDSMFQISGGQFGAIDSSFTVAGKFPQGLTVVRMKTGPDDAQTNGQMKQDAAGPSAPTQVLFRRCTLRGSDIVALRAGDAPLEALVEGSLLVGGGSPLIELAGPPEQQTTVRLVRSTLVAGDNCVRWRGEADKLASPHLKVLAWDTLIARSSAASGDGSMFALDGGDLAHVAWRSVNTVYAGWKRLLQSPNKSVGAGALALWRALWSIQDGDHELIDPWPPNLPTEAETTPRRVFSSSNSAAMFAASGGSGLLGCDLSRLPPEPRMPLQRTFEPYPIPVVALPDSDEPPPILTAEEEGTYVGERLDLTKLDLGKHLQSRLRELRPGPRVVLHLAGAGKQYTSPIKVSGVANLVLYFEPAADGAEPLTLLAKPQTVDELGALIDVEGGSLEIIKGRVVLANKRASAVPAHLLCLRGGNLTLTGCYLQGALDKAPDNYRGLIAFEGTGNTSLVLADSVLLSSRNLLDLRGGAHLRVRNCAAIGADDGFVFAAGTETFLHLENNTLAVRNAVIAAPAARVDGSHPAGNVVVQSQRNYFVNPFADNNHMAQLLRISSADLSHGIFQWQGKANAFERSRLQFFGTDTDVIGKSIKDWQQLWGSAGEQDATFVQSTKFSKSFGIDPPSWAYLDLPAAMRAGSGPPPFGADLVRLGIIKRKR